MTVEDTKLTILEMAHDLKSMNVQISKLTTNMEEMQRGFMQQTNIRLAVNSEKIMRLERVVYGLIALVAASLVTAVFSILN